MVSCLVTEYLSAFTCMVWEATGGRGVRVRSRPRSRGHITVSGGVCGWEAGLLNTDVPSGIIDPSHRSQD